MDNSKDSRDKAAGGEASGVSCTGGDDVSDVGGEASGASGKDCADSSMDISVLLVFFTRYELFRRVFEQVRRARPKRLFLYQDGPRADHPEDMERILRCREIASGVDWDCEVHTLYQKENHGVDPSGYLADKWAFSMTDRCIVLEDDCLPSLSFFSFCARMLDKYENEPRVMLISGFNVEEVTRDVDSDYFFSSTTFTWGWASWKRVVDMWDSSCPYLEDERKCRRIQEYIDKKGLVRNMLHICRSHRDSGKAHFETILIANQYLRRGLTIVPAVNLINNTGISGESSHFASDLSLIPKGFRRVFTMRRFEMDTDNLRCPEKITDHDPYRKRSYRIYGWGHPAVKVYRLAESMYYKLRSGRGGEALSEFKDRLVKLVKRNSA